MRKFHTDAEILQVGSEVDSLIVSGQVLAITCSVILADGDARTWIRYLEGQKFPLLAATDILHNEMLQCCVPVSINQEGKDELHS